MSTPIPLSALVRKDRPTIDTLRTDLRNRGFVCVHVDHEALSASLQDALVDAAALDGFRFPPIDASQPDYTPPRRAAFESLFQVATTCLDALFTDETVPKFLADALEDVRTNGVTLFDSDHEPFTAGQPFSQSFFNLFNYNQGLLNPHADRSLLTVIRVQAGLNLGAQSALWVRGPDDSWHNADAAVGADEVIILVGEDCEALPAAQRLGLYGAEHAVRVDPTGQYVSHSHFRPDPDTPPNRNRISAAFILRHEPPDML